MSEIIATTPPGAAGPADVRVTKQDGRAVVAPGGILYVDPLPNPTIESIAPFEVPTEGGTEITILGENLDSSDAVTIIGVAAPPVDPVDPPVSGPWNEPARFTPVIEATWDDLDGWYHGDNNNKGSVDIVGGKLVWTYFQGASGGGSPGSRVLEEGMNFGPTHYQRDEGVMHSANWTSHGSGFNKFRFWQRAGGKIHGYIFFESSDLEVAMNTQEFALGTEVWRWDDADNQASPSQSEARSARGVPHIVESLLHKGTPGNADGWVKVWLDGVLILHFINKAFTPSGESPTFAGAHFAPIWGGTGGSLPAQQTLTIDNSYVSFG